MSVFIRLLMVLGILLVLCTLAIALQKTNAKDPLSEQRRPSHAGGNASNASHVILDLMLQPVNASAAQRALGPSRENSVGTPEMVVLTLMPKTAGVEGTWEVGVEASGFRVQHAGTYCIYANILFNFTFEAESSEDLHVALIQDGYSTSAEIKSKNISCCPSYTIRLVTRAHLNTGDVIHVIVSEWSSEHIVYKRETTFAGLFESPHDSNIPCI